MRFWAKTPRRYSDDELHIIRETAVSDFKAHLRSTGYNIISNALLDNYRRNIDRNTATIENLKVENANLQAELNKYKELYADETQKRLAFAEQLRKYEGESNAES